MEGSSKTTRRQRWPVQKLSEKQVSMLLAIAGKKGLRGTRFLEWLEFDSGYGLSIDRQEDLNTIPAGFMDRLLNKLNTLSDVE